jgi:hypothetical protein
MPGIFIGYVTALKVSFPGRDVKWEVGLFKQRLKAEG